MSTREQTNFLINVEEKERDLYKLVEECLKEIYKQEKDERKELLGRPRRVVNGKALSI